MGPLCRGGGDALSCPPLQRLGLKVGVYHCGKSIITDLPERILCACIGHCPRDRLLKAKGAIVIDFFSINKNLKWATSQGS